MPIRLNKLNKTLTCNSFVEMTNVSSQQKFPFSHNRNTDIYTITSKNFIESIDNKISFDNDPDTMSVTAKELLEEGEKVRPFKAIIPEFELINNKIYIKEDTLQTYERFGINREDLIIGIQVKHATFSRGRYKKATKKRKLLSAKGDLRRQKWARLRDNNGGRGSPYQWAKINGTWVTPGYQHSGSQARKHFKAIKLRKHYMLTTRPQKYFYNGSSFTYLYIAENREVVFLDMYNIERNVYLYFANHLISKADFDNEKNSLSSSKWLKYNFILKTRAIGTLQSSDFFKVYYNSYRTMTSIEL